MWEEGSEAEGGQTNEEQAFSVETIQIVCNQTTVAAFQLKFSLQEIAYQLTREWTQFTEMDEALEAESKTTAPYLAVPRLVVPRRLWASEKDPLIWDQRKAAILVWFPALLTFFGIIEPYSAFRHFISLESDFSHVSLQNPAKEGFLVKEGHIFKAWRKRWFVLVHAVLFYFHDETVHFALQICQLTLKRTALAGVIPLTKMTARQCPEKNLPFCFTVRPLDIENYSKIYFLMAPDEKEMNHWISLVIQAQCNSTIPVAIALSTTSSYTPKLKRANKPGFNDLRSRSLSIDLGQYLDANNWQHKIAVMKNKVDSDLTGYEEDLNSLKAYQKLDPTAQEWVSKLSALSLTIKGQTVNDLIAKPQFLQAVIRETNIMESNGFPEELVQLRTRLLYLCMRLNLTVTHFRGLEDVDDKSTLKPTKSKGYGHLRPIGGQPIAACRLCNQKYKGKDLPAHEIVCSFLSSNDLESGRSDARLYRFIDTVNQLIETHTAEAQTEVASSPSKARKNITNLHSKIKITSASVSDLRNSSHVAPTHVPGNRGVPRPRAAPEVPPGTFMIYFPNGDHKLINQSSLPFKEALIRQVERKNLLFDKLDITSCDYKKIRNETPLDQIPGCCCFLSHMKLPSSPGTPKENLEETKSELLRLVRAAILAAEIPISETQHSIPALEQILNTIESNLRQTGFSIVSVTVAQKLLAIIQQKYSIAMEYHHLSNTKGEPVQGLTQQRETPTGTSSSFGKAWGGFLSLFTLPQKTNTQPEMIELQEIKPPIFVSTPPTTMRETVSIHSFSIIKPISRAAYGRVFLCKKKDTGDAYAIKVLQKGDVIRKNQDSISETIVASQHPFVVELFYAFQSIDYVYIVMEYLPGGDMSSLLLNLTYFEEPMARLYIAELVIVVEYLHSIGIIHRDLKPSNILIAEDGHIKLTDFGLSNVGAWDDDVPKTTGALTDLSGSAGWDCNVDVDVRVTGTKIFGTPDYLSPEALLGEKTGFEADWWAVGVIAFEFLTGSTPFGDQTPEAVFSNILNKARYEWPSSDPFISDQAQGLVNGLLVHSPKNRLGTGGAREVKEHAFFSKIDWMQLFSSSIPNAYMSLLVNADHPAGNSFSSHPNRVRDLKLRNDLLRIEEAEFETSSDFDQIPDITKFSFSSRFDA